MQSQDEHTRNKGKQQKIGYDLVLHGTNRQQPRGGLEMAKFC